MKTTKVATSIPVIVLVRPAPLLEYLMCLNELELPRDLCGDKQGRLRRLDIRSLWLPVASPALSTVTHLTVAELSIRRTTRDRMLSLTELFRMMPRLQSLSLPLIKVRMSPQTFAGPAPASLRSLTLHADSDRGGLALCVSGWRTESLREVHIAVGRSDFEEDDWHVLFDGALSLEAAWEDDARCLRVYTSSMRDGPQGIRGTTCTLLVRTRSAIPAVGAATTLRKYESQFSGLQDIAGPVAFLNAFFGLGETAGYDLRRMRMSLRIARRPITKSDLKTYMECDQLSFLSAFQGRIAQIEVAVETKSLFYPLDARRLVAALAARVQNRADVVIAGFPRACTMYIDAGRNRISFVDCPEV